MVILHVCKGMWFQGMLTATKHNEDELHEERKTVPKTTGGFYLPNNCAQVVSFYFFQHKKIASELDVENQLSLG